MDVSLGTGEEKLITEAINGSFPNPGLSFQQPVCSQISTSVWLHLTNHYISHNLQCCKVISAVANNERKFYNSQNTQLVEKD